MDLPTKRKICLGGIGPNVIFLIFNVIDTDISHSIGELFVNTSSMDNIIWHRDVILVL